MLTPYYRSVNRDFTLLKGDCIELLNSFEFKFDMIFADPPYHLSNGGISVQSGKMVSVNKGAWDKSNGYEEDYLFDKSWIATCRDKLKSNGTIWISGTYHNIFSSPMLDGIRLQDIELYYMGENKSATKFVTQVFHSLS